jgi:hypothetical protein
MSHEDADAENETRCCDYLGHPATSFHQKQHHAVPSALERKAACVAASGPSLGRKRPRRAAIAAWGGGGRYRIPYLSRSRSAAQLNVGKRRASKGVTERYEGLWRSPLAHHFRIGPALHRAGRRHGRGRAAAAGVSDCTNLPQGRQSRRPCRASHSGHLRTASRTSLPLRRDGHTKVYAGDQKRLCDRTHV